MDKAPKRRIRLTLDPNVAAAAERYGKRHGTNLSQLVNDFLGALTDPTASEARALAPAVRRLHGIAVSGTGDRAAHWAHLIEKYGSEG